MRRDPESPAELLADSSPGWALELPPSPSWALELPPSRGCDESGTPNHCGPGTSLLGATDTVQGLGTL